MNKIKYYSPLIFLMLAVNGVSVAQDIQVNYDSQEGLHVPIPVGSYSKDKFSYTDARNTEQYAPQPIRNGLERISNSKCVYYEFELTSPMFVSIDHEGSTIANATRIFIYRVNDDQSYSYSEHDGITIDPGITLVHAENNEWNFEDPTNPDFKASISDVLLSTGRYWVYSAGADYYSGYFGGFQTIDGIIVTNIKGVPMSVEVPPTDDDGDDPPSQSDEGEKNFIMAIAPTQSLSAINDAMSVNEALKTINYYDGLGRPVITLKHAFSPSQQDIVTFQEYDTSSRVDKTWLPIPVSSNKKLPSIESLKEYSELAYEGDKMAFSQNVYEDSPLNRAVEQYGPGQDWHENGKAVRSDLMTNIVGNDTLNCVRYEVTDEAITVDTLVTITNTGNYPNCCLFVTRTTDEDGNSAFEFKDLLGKVVLTRQVQRNNDGTKQTFDTYYVYNQYLDNVAVIPPKASDEMKECNNVWTNSNSSLIRNYVYLYRYDYRKRCVAKRLPGQGWTYIVYDDTDNPIFVQDANQRQRNEWLFRISDVLGRECFSGICNNSFSVFDNPLKKVVVSAEWMHNMGHEEYIDSDLFKGYKYTGPSLISPTIYSVNYYDDYTFLGRNGLPDSTDIKVKYEMDAEIEYGKQCYTTKTMLTGTLTAILNETLHTVPTYLYSVLYYDDRNRIIQSKANNHLGGIEKEYIAYDFISNPLKRKHVHYIEGKPVQNELYTYTYDHAGRLLTTTHMLNSNSEMLLTNCEFDELGRLMSNKRNGQSNLITSNTYNIRSWIKTIQNPLFNQVLYYNDIRTNNTNKPAYNGNVSAMDWLLNSMLDNKKRGYDFSYDGISRLLKADYLENNVASTKFSAAYEYDKHGNMISLIRSGNTGTTTYGTIDNLTFSYYGNQLLKVEDSAANPTLSMSMDFKDGAHENVEYWYDENGNMVKDLNKGISMIEYNSLNLPRRVTFTGANNPVYEYVYSAGGKKLSVIHRSSTEKRTDYVGNMIYENGSLKRILVDGGYIENGQYHFYLQDHLGNNRVVVKSDGTVIQMNHYYPYGMSFAEGTFADKQPYKYNGKELDTENGLNLYDYDARQMDIVSGRFTSVDPMAEKYYSVSPYAYCGNNPVMLVDVNGKEWGIVLNANGTMTVTLAVNLRTSSDLNLTSSQIGEIKTAISTQLNNTLQEVSGGKISASMSFDGGKDPNRLTPTITLTGGDEMGLGITGFSGDALLNMYNASDMTEFGETGVHELFHTLNLQDLADTPYISDTRMTKSSHGYRTTLTTANDIHKNIMNYGSTKIDGKSYKEIYNSRSGMNKITKGQLLFLLKSILKQSNGYGTIPQRKTTETDEEYKQRYNQYYENYWLYPENM